MFRRLWKLCRSWFTKQSLEVDEFEMRMRDIESFLVMVYAPWFEARDIFVVHTFAQKYIGVVIYSALYQEKGQWKWGLSYERKFRQYYTHWSTRKRHEWALLVRMVPDLIESIHKEQELDLERVRDAQTILEKNFLLPQLNLPDPLKKHLLQ